MKKLKVHELTDWYCEQDFDTVEKITGVDIWSAYEDDEIEEGNPNGKVSRNDALDQAREVWDKLSKEEKQSAYDNYNRG